MDSITPAFVDELIDFAPPDIDTSSKSLGDTQRAGTVAIFNMLAKNRCAYLADEVGMGKTYIALAVMSLLRYFNPQARVVVIAPRQNIQEKWRKELVNFVRNNWRIRGNRVKTLDSTPVWEPLLCNNLREFAHECLVNQDRDFFLRMSSFSLAAKNPEDRLRMRTQLVSAIPWLKNAHIDVETATGFLESYAIALNGAIPQADLVIVDEAHNLKRGLSLRNISNRNLVMGRAFGASHANLDHPDWFSQKAKRVLLLSATPFEDDYADVQRQLEVFGFGNAELLHPTNIGKLGVEELAAPHADMPGKRKIVERLMVRRTGGILIGDRKFTKNMYRREWRQGGITEFDQPIRLTNPMTRLVVGLVQKKVAEVLKNEKFSNSFQIGMLSSFESFAESLGRTNEATFDDAEQQQQLDQQQREGIDSNAVVEVSRSFYSIFGKPLPHPKQEHVVDALHDVFDTGDKALIFCRRVATVGELARKLSDEYNELLRRRILADLPEFKTRLGEIFELYTKEYRSSRLDLQDASSNEGDGEEATPEETDKIESRTDLQPEADAGGIKSLFEWFFRGEGPKGVLSGAAFQRNRLNNAASSYSVLFEDNFLSALFQTTPAQVLSTLAEQLEISYSECIKELQSLAYAYFRERSGSKAGYARLYVFESYQVAALLMLKDRSALAGLAEIILQERFPDYTLKSSEQLPPGFPGPEEALASTTVFTELRRHSELEEALLPPSKALDERGAFRLREQRRELFGAIVRLGAPSVDLYCLAIQQIGSLELGVRETEDNVVPRLAQAFVELLASQREKSGFHAFYELSQAAKTFNTLVSVNFPDINSMKLTQLGRYFGSALGHQAPVGDVSGQVNKRLIAQFRMPGYPLVLISTDVLQEGEDLHTFCKNVLHYGIAWTPSSMEQRTGRVDRIGGLLQRNLDGRDREPEPEELIQVHYPHLRDTVEFLQVKRVLRRYNTFLQLMHEAFEEPRKEESTINADEAIHDDDDIEPQYDKPLTSAFDVSDAWLNGKANAKDVVKVDWESSFNHFATLRNALSRQYSIRWHLNRSDHEFEGTVDTAQFAGANQKLHQPVQGATHDFSIRLRSHVAGEQTLLQIESAIAEVDLQDDRIFDLVQFVVAESNDTKICVEPRIGRELDRVFIRQEMLYEAEVSQIDDLTHLFEAVVIPAVRLHRNLGKAEHDRG